MAFHNDDDDDGGWDRAPDESELESFEPPYDADRGCPKCGCPETHVSEMRTEGGTASAVMDINAQFFRVVSCKGCGYSELYRDRRGHGSRDIVETFLE